MKTAKIKSLVLENDFEISEYLTKYLKTEGLEPVMLTALEHRVSEEISEEFAKAEVLIVEPTIIKFGQYNLMLMLMYDLLTKGKLAIKEVRIFANDYGPGYFSVEHELKELWESKTKYLSIVLEKVKIFAVDKGDYTKTELKLL